MGPKEKRERSLGERLGLKGTRCQSAKCAMVRRPHRPGVHGHKRQRGNLSDFGRQLKEKQKFKVSYGLDERNLRALFGRAERKTGDVAAALMALLERRLDNVVFRLGFATSRSMARQFILHGHITVNGNRVRSPGFQVEVSDTVAIRPEAQMLTSFKELREKLMQYELPGWLVLDRDRLEGKILSAPSDLVPPFEINLLVESFSK